MQNKKIVKLIIHLFLNIFLFFGTGCQKNQYAELEKKQLEFKDHIVMAIDNQNKEIDKLKEQIKEMKSFNKDLITFESKLGKIESNLGKIEKNKIVKKPVILTEKNKGDTAKLALESTKVKFDTLNMEVSEIKKDLHLIKRKIASSDSTDIAERWLGFPVKFINHKSFVQFDQDKEYFKVAGKLVNLSNKSIKNLVIKGKIYGLKDEILEEASAPSDMIPQKILPQQIIRFILTFSNQPAYSDRYKLWVDKYQYD
ncbi:hypothetical protein HY745_05395 [Candidatus Desantisbacteria bacterium]|nr:hypothetical protein [Candidatus Desantisbacteria bacterium]